MPITFPNMHLFDLIMATYSLPLSAVHGTTAHDKEVSVRYDYGNNIIGTMLTMTTHKPTNVLK